MSAFEFDKGAVKRRLYTEYPENAHDLRENSSQGRRHFILMAITFIISIKRDDLHYAFIKTANGYIIVVYNSILCQQKGIL